MLFKNGSNVDKKSIFTVKIPLIAPTLGGGGGGVPTPMLVHLLYLCNLQGHIYYSRGVQFAKILLIAPT